MRWERLNYRQKYIEHGYKELTMPPTASGEYAIPTNYLHIWPRQEFMMIALPNKDHTFTLTLALLCQEDLLAFFMKYFPDSVDEIGMERLVQDYCVLFLGLELQFYIEQCNLWCHILLWLHLKPCVGECLLEGHSFHQP